MKIKIISADRGILLEDEECSLVEANSVEGQIGIMEGHAPYTAMLYPGWLRVHTEHGVKEWYVRDGLLDVRNGYIEASVTHVFDPQKTSREDLEQRLEQALARYGSLDPKDVKENARVMKEIDWLRGCLDLLDQREHNP